MQLSLNLEWMRAYHSVRWEHGRTDEDVQQSADYLVTSLDPWAAELTETGYFPLAEHTGLFRILADTPPTMDAIKAFAERYGWLGGWAKRAFLQAQGPLTGVRMLYSEPLETWQSEITTMKRCVEIWERVRKDDIEELSDLLPQEVTDWIQKHIASCAADYSNLLKSTALEFISSVINERLSKSKPSITLIQSSDSPTLTLQATPDSLISALWHQFAVAVAENRDYRYCEECGIWFEITPESARKNRIFCSNACRSKDFRGRRAARNLSADKVMSRQEIAVKLGVSVEKIDWWLDGTEKPHIQAPNKRREV